MQSKDYFQDIVLLSGEDPEPRGHLYVVNILMLVAQFLVNHKLCTSQFYA